MTLQHEKKINLQYIRLFFVLVVCLRHGEMPQSFFNQTLTVQQSFLEFLPVKVKRRF